MKLLENYSLQLGQKIDKCHTYEKYYPLPFENPIIIIQPWSKGAKNYSYINDVLDIIYPIITKAGYKLVQVGGPNEKVLKYCYHTQGTTNWGQLEYLISKSSLVISADSISSHLAGHYNIPLCVLISNNFKETVSPYFGDKSKQIVLEPDRNNKNPLFMLDEPGKKQIDEIKTEDIAKSVCSLLNIEYTYNYNTLFTGNIYQNPMIISTCNDVINPAQIGVDSLILDLTLSESFNENILIQQAQICPVSIICNKPLSDNIFNFHKQTKRIREVLYVIDENNSPDFARKVQRNGINLRLISELLPEKINKLKLDYMEISVINKLNYINPKEIEELKNKDLNNLYFKSAKFYISGGQIYPSKAHLLAKQNVGNFDQIVNCLNNLDFIKEMDSFRILEKLT